MSVRQNALDYALTFVGTKEDPPGVNRGPLIDAWNRAAGVPVGSSWCMSFVHAMYLKAGKNLGGGASVGNFEAWATKLGEISARPYRGDLVCYDWNDDGWADHVGIVVKVLALRWRSGVFVGWVKTVEGNTSNPSGGFDGVFIKKRWIQTAKFVTVKGAS